MKINIKTKLKKMVRKVSSRKSTLFTLKILFHKLTEDFITMIGLTN